mgnify:CR=1 FL=1
MKEDSMDPMPEPAPDARPAMPGEVALSDRGRKFLSQTRPWVRFMSVMIFAGAVFMILGGVMVAVVGLSRNTVPDGGFAGLPFGNFLYLGLLYVALALLYVGPGVCLSRFAAAIKKLEAAPASEALEKVLKSQRSFWRYVGILAVVSLVVLASLLAFFLAVTLFMFINR